MLLIPTLLCPKTWESMTGTQAERFCGHCQKHVHNLAAMSAQERLALLSSPAAKICSRYRVAIRRPVSGRERSYARHLGRYGAGIALSGSVLLVLWELLGPTAPGDDRSAWFRVMSPVVGAPHPMPRSLYHEKEVFLLGDVAMPAPTKTTTSSCPPGAEPAAPHVDVQLDLSQLSRMIEAPPRPAAFPALIPAPRRKK